MVQLESEFHMEPSLPTRALTPQAPVEQDSLLHRISDAYCPVVQQPAECLWEEAARQVLSERSELWERLSKL